MANMSYCRFRNTLLDFLDCQYTLQDILDGNVKLSEEEADACNKLRNACERYIEDYNIVKEEGLL